MHFSPPGAWALGLLLLIGAAFLVKRLLKALFGHLNEPLNVIREQPYQFVVWWIVANIFGLAGFLLPLLLRASRGEKTHDVFIGLIKANSLASFSIVLLAEGIASALVAIGVGKNIIAAGLRGLISVLALGVVMIQVGILVMQSAGPTEPIPSPTLQLLVTVAAILVASYLYCFRFGSWEKGVDSVQKDDDEAVANLEKSANATSVDEGIKL